MSTASIVTTVHEHAPQTREIPSSPRSLSVRATYWLSESGRKAALLAGQDGRAQQNIWVDVPVARLHLVSVDANGIARLRLRPRFERELEQRIVRIDTSPTYDVPPSLDDLFGCAARNYELERLYEAERAAARAQRLDAERDLRARVAHAFLGDVSHRALPHPAPSPTRCYVMTEQGRRLFDVSTDEGAARDLPPEAHRRFRADLRTRAERQRHERAAQQTLHQEKRETIAVWIAANGTPDQQARQRAGVLPFAEAIEALTTQVFAPAGERPLYQRDGAQRLQQHLRESSPSYADTVVAPADLVVTSSEATTASQAQWHFMEELRANLPSASVRLRAHRLSWRRDAHAPSVTVFSVSVVQKNGLFSLRREYAAPD
jgi:hypothetical protein